MTDKRKYKRVTDLECDLILRMLRGKHYLMHRTNHAGKTGYMMYEGHQDPVKWYSDKTAKVLHNVLKADTCRRYTINLSLVRQLDGRCYLKKQYKKTRRTKVTF